MSEKFSSKLAQVKHAVFYGTSDFWASNSDWYKEKNDAFQKNKAKVVKRTVQVVSSLLTVAAQACSPTPVSAPSLGEQPIDNSQNTTEVVPPVEQPAIPEAPIKPEVVLLGEDDCKEVIAEKGLVDADPTKCSGIAAEATKYVFIPNEADQTVDGYMKRDSGWQDLQGLPVTQTQTVWILEGSQANTTDPSGLPTPEGQIPQPETVLDYDLNVTEPVIKNGIAQDQLIVNVRTKDGRNVPYTVPADFSKFYNNASYAPTKESPALDPEAWNQYGNVLVKNGDIDPYEKQLIVNPETSDQFANIVADTCYKVLYINAVASEFNKTRSPSTLPDKYKSYENFKKLVIDPAIASGQSIEAWQLVGHEEYVSKMPYQGMVKQIPNVDPSNCVLKIGEHKEIHASSPLLSVGSFQLGTSFTEVNSRTFPVLIVNVDKTRENQYGFFFANNDTTVEQNAVAYSQLIETVNDMMSLVVEGLSSSKATKNDFVYTSSKDVKPGFAYALPNMGGVDLVIQSMKEAPNYFVAP